MTARLSKQLQLKLLGSIVEFMMRSGVSESSVSAAFDRGLQKSRACSVRTGARDVAGRYPSGGDVSAHLLRLWHRDHRLTDSEFAKPRPLHLSRGKRSLRSLLLSLDQKINVTEVLKAMKSMGLIRRNRDGRYVPTQSAAVFSDLHPLAVEHAAKSIVRLVSTVLRNTTSGSDEPPLLERYSYVPDLKPTEALAFAEFARSQGQAYLDVLDDWLEQRRVVAGRSSRSSGSKGIAAGVHLIAYLGRDDSGSGIGSRLHTNKSRTSATRAVKRGATRRASQPPPATPS